MAEVTKTGSGLAPGSRDSATVAKMKEGRKLHTAAMAKLSDEHKHAYKLCSSAITTIEMVQRRLLRGAPVQGEFLASIGTLQSYGAGMLS